MALKLKLLFREPLFWILFLTGAIKLYLIIRLNGSDWEPDAYQHFLDLRSVYEDFPNMLPLGLTQWSKPLYTYLFGAIVQIGNFSSLTVIQLVNLILSLLTAWFVARLSIDLSGSKKAGYLSAILYSFGWISFQSSLTAMTEPLYTFILLLGFYYTYKQRYQLASFLIGLSILVRFEGLLLLGIYGLYLLTRLPEQKKLLFLFRNWIIAVLPLLLWNFLGYLASGSPLFLLSSGYTNVPDGSYGYGNWWHFPAHLLYREPATVLLYLTGFYQLTRKAENSHKRSILWLANTMFLAFLLFQTVLWVYGLFGSAGLLRYFVGVMPLMLIIASLGWFKLEKSFLKKRMQIILLSAIATFTIMLSMARTLGIGFEPVLPQYPTAFRDAGIWIKENVDESALVYSTRPEVSYFAERKFTNTIFTYSEEVIEQAAQGTIFIWTGDWGESYSGLSAAEIVSKGTVIFDNSSEVTPDNLVIIVRK